MDQFIYDDFELESELDFCAYRNAYTYKDGSVYIGQWLSENYKEKKPVYSKAVKKEVMIRQGKGTFIKNTGSLYEGYFQNDCFHSHGRYINSDGDVYTGEFKQGKKSGEGTLIWLDGRKYTGNWYGDK